MRKTLAALLLLGCARLKAAGYSDADLVNMWSNNILRSLDKAREA